MQHELCPLLCSQAGIEPLAPCGFSPQSVSQQFGFVMVLIFVGYCARERTALTL